MKATETVFTYEIGDVVRFTTDNTVRASDHLIIGRLLEETGGGLTRGYRLWDWHDIVPEIALERAKSNGHAKGLHADVAKRKWQPSPDQKEATKPPADSNPTPRRSTKNRFAFARMLDNSHMTMEDFAELAGVSRATIDNLYNGVYRPKSRVANAIAYALGATLEELGWVRKKTQKKAKRDTYSCNLRSFMNTNNITEKEIAAATGLSPSGINKIANGVHRPRAETARKIAECFNVSSAALGW